MDLLFGSLISIFVNIIKKRLELKDAEVILFLAMVALLAALLYHLMASVGILKAFIEIMTTAGAFWAFLLKHLDKSN